MKDIHSREDITLLLRNFYQKALNDPSIGSFFTEIAQIDLEAHLPHITDFWEQQLFYTGTYKKNVLQIHQNIHSQKVIQTIHFEQWLSLFNSTVDELFKGEKADLAKTRALSIATVIRVKINTPSLR